MAKLSFLHAADLHLGSSLQTNNFDDKQTQELFDNAIYNVFKRLVNKALQHQVDFILLAGDVYDRAERSVRANRFFASQCQRLAKEGILVYLIAGNHDPLSSRKNLFSLPDNVVEFRAEKVENHQFKREDGELVVEIIAQSYQNKFESEKLYQNYQPSLETDFRIALLHTQLDSGDKKYIPASRSQLVDKNGIDYWALGHIHQFRLIETNNPVIAYSGIPQGRDFGETGLGGCLLVEIDNDSSLQYKFLPLAEFVFKRVELNIDKLAKKPANITELAQVLIEKTAQLAKEIPELDSEVEVIADDWQEFFKGYLIQWVIKGPTKLNQILAEQSEETVKELLTLLAKEEFTPNSVWIDDIRLQTRQELPGLEELLAQDDQLFTEIAQVLKLARAKGELELELKEELGQIWENRVDHEDLELEKFQLTSKAYRDILNAAENLIISELISGRD